MTLAETTRTVEDASFDNTRLDPRIPFWRVQDQLVVHTSDGSLEAKVQYALLYKPESYWPDVPEKTLSTNLIVVRSDTLLEGESDEALEPLGMYTTSSPGLVDPK